METTLKVIFGTIIAVLIMSAAFLCAVPLVVLNAYVGQDLWGMYILPLTGIAVPNLWTMAGLFAVLHFFKGIKIEPEDKDKKKSETPVWDALRPFLLSLVFTLLLWGEAHLFFWLAS